MGLDAHALPAAQPTSQRRLRNILVDPRFQIPWVLGVGVLTLAIFFTLGAIIVHQDTTASEAVLGGLNSLYDPEQAALLTGLFTESDRSVLWALVAVGVVLVLALSASLLVLTHRVAGPMVALRSSLAALARGRYTRVRPFRRGDAFREVSDELLAAARTLRARDELELEQLLEALNDREAAPRIIAALAAEKRLRLDA